MTVHLYCLVPHQSGVEIPAELVGISSAAVRPLAIEDLVAWVSELPPGTPVTIDGVKAHDAVVEAALASGCTPIPARFGQRFESEEACRAAITHRAPALASLLATVQGHVEMTLILTPSTGRMIRDLQPIVPQMAKAGDSGAGVGRRYLEHLRAREAATGAVRQALDALAARLADASQRFVRRSTTHEQLARMPLRTVSHLIARELVEPYQEALRAVRPSSEFRFLVVGPRAPYSFCAVGTSAGAHGMQLDD